MILILIYAARIVMGFLWIFHRRRALIPCYRGWDIAIFPPVRYISQHIAAFSRPSSVFPWTSSRKLFIHLLFCWERDLLHCQIPQTWRPSWLLFIFSLIQFYFLQAHNLRNHHHSILLILPRFLFIPRQFQYRPWNFHFPWLPYPQQPSLRSWWSNFFRLPPNLSS